ncbi:MAG: T9SS type A sorting domain-containing protein [Saprospiraceae bacterium]|nr:T9SS type A sorting domain-containing protein [Saprospiraceae bacterium]
MKTIFYLLAIGVLFQAPLFAATTLNTRSLANPVTADFTIAINCNSGNWLATATANNSAATNNVWQLWSTPTAGTITGGTLEATINGGLSATFSWLDLAKNYYIRHYSEVSGLAVVTNLAVPTFASNANLTYVLKRNADMPTDNFCYGEDIYLDATGTTNYDRYFIAIWRRPSNSPGNFTLYADYGWTISNSIGPVTNLSEIIRFQGENPGEIFEPGYVYEVQFAIANPPNCIPWIELKRQFRVECCTDFFSASFNLETTTTPWGSLALEVDDFISYDNYATHHWTILSSPNAYGGPYTLEGEKTTLGHGPHTIFYGASPQRYYFVVHRISTLCGDYCYGQGEDDETGHDCDVCGEIDCSVLHNLCLAPGYVEITSSHWTEDWGLLWGAVPGADGYVVEVIVNDPKCCENGQEVQTRYYHTTDTQYLPIAQAEECFKARVGTVCNGETSWSTWLCVQDFFLAGITDEIKAKASQKGAILPDDPSAEFLVYPNPTNSALNILLPKSETAERIQLMNMQGHVVFEQTTPDQQLSIDCKSFPAGMYTIHITYADQSQAIQKVQIIHP